MFCTNNLLSIDGTITLSLILAVCALLAPIITTAINNHYQLNLKKVQYEQEYFLNVYLHKRELIEEYFKRVNKCIMMQDVSSVSEYSEIYHVAKIYFPDSIWEVLEDIVSQIENKDFLLAGGGLNRVHKSVESILHAPYRPTK